MSLLLLNEQRNKITAITLNIHSLVMRLFIFDERV